MPVSAARQLAADNALNSLEQERYGDLLDTITSFTFDESSKAATVSYFSDTVPKALDALKTRLDGLDDGDDAGWARWVSDAGELHKGMADVKGYSGEWSFTGVLLNAGAAAKQTATDVGAAAAKIPQAAAIGAGLFTFAALAYVAWKVTR